MKLSAFTVTADGLLREIITQAKIRQAGLLYRSHGIQSEEKEIFALWDTGASCSVISSGLASTLNLKPVDKCFITGVGGKQESNVYIIDVLLPNGVAIKDIHVTEFVNNDKFDIILGMDIITLGDFSITNYNKKTVVSFRIPPDTYHIDYVKMSTANKSAKNMRDRLKKAQKR